MRQHRYMFRFILVGAILGSVTFSSATPSYNPYTTGSAASGTNQTGGVSVLQSGQNEMHAQAIPISNPSASSENAITAPAPSSIAAPVATQTTNGTVGSPVPTIQYTAPTALAQPANNVGQFSNSQAQTSKPYVFINSQNNINNASKAPPSFTPGLLPTNSVLPPVPSSGTGPEGSSLLQVAQLIHEGVNSIDQKIANQLTAAQNAKADYEPTSDNFVPVDSGFSSLSNLYISQSNFKTLWTNQANQAREASSLLGRKNSTMTQNIGLDYSSVSFTPEPNFFDLSFYRSGVFSAGMSGLQSNPVAPAISYSLDSLGELYNIPTGSDSSQMDMLENAVLTPLSSDGKWLKQLKRASTPQLLRTIALQNAIRNYLLYQSLRRQNEQELLEMAQLNLLDSIHSDTNQRLDLLDRDLVKSQQQMINLLTQVMKSSSGTTQEKR